MAILDLDTQVSTFVEGLDHPEGIACGIDGFIYAGGEAGQIYRVNPNNRALEQLASTEGGFMAGLALDTDNNIYACAVGTQLEGNAGGVLRITTDGTVSTYSTGATDEPFRIPNYPVFDKEGYLYVSDSGEMYTNNWSRISKENGYICKIPPGGGEGSVWNRDLSQFPNGLCLSPDNEYLYVVISMIRPRIDRVEIKSDGNSGSIETVVELPGTVPDGLAFDTAGNLYISCYRPDRVYRLDTKGDLMILAEEPTGHLISAPTNVAFCGQNRDILLSTNLGRWHLTQYKVEFTGAVLNYPRIPF